MIEREPRGDIEREPDEEGIDVQALKETIGFVLRAPRRRPFLAALIFTTVGGLGLAVAVTMPRTYNAQVKLLAQNNLVLPAITNPHREIPREADNPTRNVADTVLRRDNLVALVKESNLIDRFYASRAPALRLRDSIVELMSGAPTEEEKLRGLVGALEKKLFVTADENSVTISVDWADPHMAYELVTLVQKNFVEARYDSEVKMIQDAIAVLEEHSKTELEQVDSALADYETLAADRAAKMAPAAASVVVAAPVQQAFASAAPHAGPPQMPDPDVAKALEEKRRQIRLVEDEHQRELDGMRQQLMQAQLTLTPMHPTVIALQQKVDTLSRPSPDLIQLKNEERALMSQIVLAPTGGGLGAGALRPAAVGVPAPEPRAAWGNSSNGNGPNHETDPSLAPARKRLEAAIERYQDIQARIDSAKLELDISRTAYRYRYSVITPAEVPRVPKKPVALLVGIGSVLAAVLLAILGAAATDRYRGHVLETWEVRRRLKLDVLGELEPPV
ncbi:MAG: hypothetical protein M3O36_16635 [Myxococcota bacterium]|nr:hypothetical protein [Myxococcota bacterium]